MKLKDRIAIITGATSGIGEASALLFAEEGARVAVTGRDDARGRKVVAAIASAGGTVIFVRADVRLRGDCERVVAETLRAFGGRLDILQQRGRVPSAQRVDCTDRSTTADGGYAPGSPARSFFWTMAIGLAIVWLLTDYGGEVPSGSQQTGRVAAPVVPARSTRLVNQVRFQRVLGKERCLSAIWRLAPGRAAPAGLRQAGGSRR